MSAPDCPTLYLLAAARLYEPGGGWHLDQEGFVVDTTGRRRLRIVPHGRREYILRYDDTGDVRTTLTWDVEYGLRLVGWMV